MNKKAYIKWQIKELLPAYIIALILIASIFWIAITSWTLMPTATYYTDVNDYYVSFGSAYPPLYSIIIPAIIAATAFPIAVFSYQTSHVRSDFFYQIPLKKGELRRIRLILNLVILLAIVTVVYWFGVGIMGIKQATFNMSAKEGTYFYNNPYYYNYGYLALFYVIMIVAVACHYFISAFFLSLGTKTVDSVFYLIFGHGIMIGTIEAFFLVFVYFGAHGGIVNLVGAFPSISFIEPLIDTHIIGLLVYCPGGLSNLSASEIGSRITCGIIYLLLSGFVAWYILFKKKDPSGEYAGKGVPTNDFTFLFPHVFALVTGLYISLAVGALTSLMVVAFAFYIIFWAAAYYFCIVFVNGGFHFDKKNWIYFASVVSVVVILTISAALYLHLT